MTLTRSGRILFVWVLFLSLATAAPLLLAQSDGNEKKENKKDPHHKIRLSVLVILASETDTEVEKRLECIAREVRKMNDKLKGFRMGPMGCKPVTVGSGVQKLDLVEGAKVTIDVQGACSKTERIRLKVYPPQMGPITYSTPCGKFLPIITPIRTKAGEVVIIAVRVQPCPGK